MSNFQRSRQRRCVLTGSHLLLARRGAALQRLVGLQIL